MNNYYNNDTNIIVDGTLASASDVENKLNDVAAGFDGVASDIGEALTISSTDITNRDIPDLAANRANKSIGFDENGDLTLHIRKGTYQGAWTTSTYYAQDDTVKDTAGAAGYGVDAILVCLVTHVSTDLVTDAANWSAFIDTSTLEQAVIDAQTAATNAATSESNAATSESNAAASANDAQLRAWEAEAARLTSDSYATEPEDVFVKTYTSNGDGTFTPTDTTEYSALHWSAKSLAADPNLKADKVVGATAGDIAELDASGNLVDSGISSSTINDKYDKSGGTITGDVRINQSVSNFNANLIMKPGSSADYVQVIMEDKNGNKRSYLYYDDVNGTADLLLRDASGVNINRLELKTDGNIRAVNANPSSSDDLTTKSYVDQQAIVFAIALG